MKILLKAAQKLASTELLSKSDWNEMMKLNSLSKQSAIP